MKWSMWVKISKNSLKQVQHSAKLIVTAWIQMISNSQSSWCILRITGNSIVTVKIQWLVEGSSWYDYADVLCHVKELIRDMINRLKPSTAFSQINWPKSFLDDLQHTINMMYIESYWLPHSNRQNTVTEWEYLMIWIYRSSVSFKRAHSWYNKPAETKHNIQPN